MKNILRMSAIGMTAVFFLMSWCMILQVSANTARNTMPCHTAQTDGGTKPQHSSAMDRCCQSGVLKAQQNFKVDFHVIDVAFSPELMDSHPAFAFFGTVFANGPLHSPPTATRLAELSLLRI